MFLELLAQHKDKLVNNKLVCELIFAKARATLTGFSLIEQSDNLRFVVFDLRFIPPIGDSNDGIIYLITDSKEVSVTEYIPSNVLSIAQYNYEYDNFIEDVISRLTGNFDKAVDYLKNGRDRNYYSIEYITYIFIPRPFYVEDDVPTIGSFFPKQVKSARNY